MSYDKKNKLHIVAVTAAIRNGEGKYLVLKRSERETAFPGYYCFPGGKVEDNETIEEALAKEVTEETGLQMKPGKILLKDGSFVRPDGQTVKFFSYLVEVADGAEVKPSEDFTGYLWISAEDLKSIPHVGLTEELRKAEEIVTSGVSLQAFATKSEKRS